VAGFESGLGLYAREYFGLGKPLAPGQSFELLGDFEKLFAHFSMGRSIR
jgi:hypothetical protein